MEVELKETELLRLERECSISRPEVRKEWAELLDLPRLEHLSIILSKTSPTQFHWANLSHILYELHAKLPRLRILFSVNYDIMLKKAWDTDAFDDGVNYQAPYQTNGDVSVTELVEPPSK